MSKRRLQKPRRAICTMVDPDDYAYFRRQLRKHVGIEIERIVRESKEKEVLS